MVFCPECQSLPIRSILKLLQCDRSVDDDFAWFQLPRTVTDETDTQPFVRWHRNLSALQNSVSHCSFCEPVFSHLSGSYHYHNNYKDGDGRGLWLQARVGQPILTVYMGELKPEVRLSGNFWYKTTPDSSVADYFDKHAIIEDSMHPYVLGKMADWVEVCNDHHQDCLQATRNKTQLPTRLLDLDTLPKGTDLKGPPGDSRYPLKDRAFSLVENSPDSEGRYIALSYCWGKSLPFTTTSRNLQKHKEVGGIKYTQLPKTLQDAIFLVRYLGIRYLWADCLCIVQDDKADWEREASRMAVVYSNAYLTIAATRASHCGEGFLHARKVKDRRVVSFADAEGDFDLYFYYDDLTMSPGSMGSVVDESINMRREEPLLSRVWVLQERVLATRTIHFASYQMRWECAEQVITEDGYTENYKACEEISLERIADGLESVFKSPMMKTGPYNGTKRSYNATRAWSFNSAWQVWFRLVEEYTSRNMTFQSDKLPALSGVISALQNLTGDTCLAGIWKSWLLQGLLWRIQEPDWDVYVFFPKKPQRAKPWRAPSWSFASVEGVILYTLLDNDPGGKICAELQECRVNPVGKNPLGELGSGFARIKGPVTCVIDVAQQQSSSGRNCMIRMADCGLAEGCVYFDVEAYGECDVLMITPHTGIAILPVDLTNNTYIRVGAVLVCRAFKNNSLTELSEPQHPKPTVVTLL